MPPPLTGPVFRCGHQAISSDRAQHLGTDGWTGARAANLHRIRVAGFDRRGCPVALHYSVQLVAQVSWNPVASPAGPRSAGSAVSTPSHGWCLRRHLGSSGMTNSSLARSSVMRVSLSTATHRWRAACAVPDARRSYPPALAAARQTQWTWELLLVTPCEIGSCLRPPSFITTHSVPSRLA
jgi:hypothetical protein